MQSEEKVFTYSVPQTQGYKLQEGDNLYIQVTAIDPTVRDLFAGGSSSLTSVTQTALEVNGWIVDRLGTIDYPLLGQISVKGKEVAQVQGLLQTKLDSIVPQATVNVKLVNRSITILGEVKSPGKKEIARNNISIYEAIGLAGEVTDYGNRKQVTVIRNVNGEKHIKKLDLTNGDLLASVEQYVQPNDIVYVEPKNKVLGTKSISVAVVLSAISTFLAFYTTFVN